MADRDPEADYPGNALIASFVLGILESRGVLRRTNIAKTIRELSDSVPQHLVGEERIASLFALRSLLDNPKSRADFPFRWPRI